MRIDAYSYRLYTVMRLMVDNPNSARALHELRLLNQERLDFSLDLFRT